LLALLLFNGISAVFGGSVLIAAPDGSIMRMPLSFLAGTPFTDFLIPGLILLTVLGLGSCIGWVLTYHRSPIAVHWAQVVGLGTVIWIVVQIIMIQALDVLQGVYAATGIGILMLAPKAR